MQLFAPKCCLSEFGMNIKARSPLLVLSEHCTANCSVLAWKPLGLFFPVSNQLRKMWLGHGTLRLQVPGEMRSVACNHRASCPHVPERGRHPCWQDCSVILGNFQCFPPKTREVDAQCRGRGDGVGGGDREGCLRRSKGSAEEKAWGGGVGWALVNWGEWVHG